MNIFCIYRLLLLGMNSGKLSLRKSVLQLSSVYPRVKRAPDFLVKPKYIGYPGSTF